MRRHHNVSQPQAHRWLSWFPRPNVLGRLIAFDARSRLHQEILDRLVRLRQLQRSVSPALLLEADSPGRYCRHFESPLRVGSSGSYRNLPHRWSGPNQRFSMTIQMSAISQFYLKAECPLPASPGRYCRQFESPLRGDCGQD